MEFPIPGADFGRGGVIQLPFFLRGGVLSIPNSKAHAGGARYDESEDPKSAPKNTKKTAVTFPDPGGPGLPCAGFCPLRLGFLGMCFGHAFGTIVRETILDDIATWVRDV